MTKLAVCFSRGIRAIRHIESFVAVDRLIKSGDAWTEEDHVCVLVWGRKKNTQKALDFANENNLPVLYLEDGFIRTCSADSHSRLSYSMIVDRKGVYYDATVSSDLELFLNGGGTELELALHEAGEELIRACMDLVVEHNVTKYNYCIDYNALHLAGSRKRILVVDQTLGDASVIYGGMDQITFARMLDTAIEENPDADIIVKSHPDVTSGRCKGYLTDLALTRRVEILSEPVNSLSLMKTIDQVYVGTSQLGMEALLCGIRVSVFGRPFYAGWGLTDDRVTLPGRHAQRSLMELFFAAYYWYPRYVNPITGRSCLLPQCLEHTLLQKRAFALNARQFVCTGISPWKRRYVEKFLRSPIGSVTFCAPRGISQQIPETKREVLVTWGYRLPKLQNLADKSFAGRVLRLEDGFLRSTGLGSDFSAPSSLVMDESGLYFNAQGPSDLETLLNSVECSRDEILRAGELINLIICAKLSKYNVDGENQYQSAALQSQRKLLVVGQVENDASLLYGGAEITTNTGLLRKTRQNNPGAWILYKPHPDVVAGNRPGRIDQHVLDELSDEVVENVAIVSCLEHVDELHTMTSLSGFEALLRRKKVVTYGKPFYAGWGLTTDRHNIESRSRYRTLEELVHCALVAYPTYVDIETGEFASPEDIVNKMQNHQMKNNKKFNWSQRQMRKLANVCKGLSYAP